MPGEEITIPPEARELNLRALWTEVLRSCRYVYTSEYRAQFRQRLREVTGNPAVTDNLEFCDQCGVPAWNDTLRTAAHGGDVRICASCWEAWESCDVCEDWFPFLTTTLAGTEACSGCLGEQYSFCEACSGWYHNDDAASHEHEDDGSCCRSPQPEFAIRNDGCEPLASDTTITVTLPAGIISAEGLDAIRSYLRVNEYYSLSDELAAIGEDWQNPRGNFTKRLSSHAYKAFATKIPPEILSGVGNIASEHSQPVSVTLQVTRRLNMSRHAFYHSDSCWWTNYSESRCALKTNGGFGLRTFSEDGTVTGRAWVLPLRRTPSGGLLPTFDTMTPSAFAVFNGYGELSGYAAPRVLAHMAGWTYRKVGFSCSPMYVNGCTGYLAGPEDVTRRYRDQALELDVRQHASLFATEQAEKARKERENADATPS
jgi:hypothetical protein